MSWSLLKTPNRALGGAGLNIDAAAMKATKVT